MQLFLNKINNTFNSLNNFKFLFFSFRYVLLVWSVEEVICNQLGSKINNLAAC